jgi:SAM-dependent methyltransferase
MSNNTSGLQIHHILDSLTIDVLTLSNESLSELISLFRTIKQTNAKYVVLNFNDPKISFGNYPRAKDLLAWSKTGQFLTSMIVSSPIPVVANIVNRCSNEALELAFSAHHLFINDLSIFNFDASYNFKWGFLKNFRTLISDYSIRDLYSSQKRQNALDNFFAAKKISYYKNELTTQMILKIIPEDSIVSKLLSYHFSVNPLQVSPINCLESTISIAAHAKNGLLNKINYLKPAEIKHSVMKSTISDRLDDFANDFVLIDNYPDDEIRVLNRKNRIEEVKKILNSPQINFHGKCIELGSGYGYFSMLASKLPNVTEVVAFDISLAEIIRFGPYMADVLDPCLDKFSYQIGDMNQIQSDMFGKFDFVIFCASLHHSSDINKSLEVAYKLLRHGGKVILHGEHYKPVFLKAKKNDENSLPHTILDFNRILSKNGFHPHVFRYALKGNKSYFLKKMVLENSPLCYINGWIKYSSFISYGIKI